MKMLSKVEKANWYRYRKAGSHLLSRCKVNDFSWNPHNTLKHEAKKLEICDSLVRQGHKVINEAVENKTGLRRDIVDLTTGVILEVETDKTRAKRFEGIKEVEVIELWKEE